MHGIEIKYSNFNTIYCIIHIIIPIKYSTFYRLFEKYIFRVQYVIHHIATIIIILLFYTGKLFHVTVTEKGTENNYHHLEVAVQKTNQNYN